MWCTLRLYCDNHESYKRHLVRFYADLHVHSKYSRATSRDCDLENLAYWARKKGIAVVATGDFTHPAWRQEIKEQLVPAEPGLFRLRPDLERAVAERFGDKTAAPPTRFMLSVEISNIYKRDEKTRKVHNLVYVPDLEQADRFCERLSRIGNLNADGRPILGLDSRDLLEITLETGDDCYLVPAHIWTPWFAVLGSKSGFDDIGDCYADLKQHIFALETGLSSDPAMNWRISALDRYRLVSNSDAHSPPKLGREACVFDTALDYFAMRDALKNGAGYEGTIEFFPEEGKYHLDGHRKCNVRFDPEQSRKTDGICPVCGGKLTLGVLHRVVELADRPDGVRPASASPYHCLVPLAEVIAEIADTGSGSKKVTAQYEGLISRLGPELFILESAPIEEIRKEGSDLIAEAIERMRSGKVICNSGYDGAYGVIRMFEPRELERAFSLGFGWAEPEPQKESPVLAKAELQTPNSDVPEATKPSPGSGRINVEEQASLFIAPTLDPAQAEAAQQVDGPILIVAGPGTGKTRTLTHRLANLIRDHGVAPANCLAITFTRRAAEEMRERLQKLLGKSGEAIAVNTFHGLSYALLREYGVQIGLAEDFQIIAGWQQQLLLQEIFDLNLRQAVTLAQKISRFKSKLGAQRAERAEMGADRAPRSGEGEVAEAGKYQDELQQRGLLDLDDLVITSVKLLREQDEIREAIQARYRYLSIDEYQDIDAQQFALVRLLCGEACNLCAIGDPDQAIYGFRGADVRFFTKFEEDYPGTRVVQLSRNYRSTSTIVAAASQVIKPASLVPDRRFEAMKIDPTKILIHHAPTDRAEAEFVVHQCERLLGGHTFFALDSGRVGNEALAEISFGDIAVLYRSAAQAELLVEALARSGMPFSEHAHGRLCDHPEVQSILGQINPDGDLAQQIEAAAEEHNLYVEQLLRIAEQSDGTWASFVSLLALESEVDTWDPRADRIALLTLHAAKGLEFDVVFIVGCEDGVLPHRFRSRTSQEDAEEEAEELRLLFVGMTRAQKRLYLSRAEKRKWRGTVQELPVSPFLATIEEQLLEEVATSAKRKPQSNQLSLF